MPLPHVRFEHQDGPLVFSVKHASYFLSPTGMFSCSLNCEANEALDYMASPLFAVHNLPVGSAIQTGQAITVPRKYQEGQSRSLPRAHLYAGAHYAPWHVRLEVVSVGPQVLGLTGVFTTVDPNYYDSRALDTQVNLFANFTQCKESELWSPY